MYALKNVSSGKHLCENTGKRSTMCLGTGMKVIGTNQGGNDVLDGLGTSRCTTNLSKKVETRYTSENTENASRGRNDEIRQEKGNHVVIVGGKEKNAVLYVASRYI